MYKIKLQDGTVLENLTLNGNNFISSTVLEDQLFAGNLGEVEITGDWDAVDADPRGVYQDMTLAANRELDGKSWFVLAKKTPEQRMLEQLEKLARDSEEVREALEMILSGVTE